MDAETVEAYNGNTVKIAPQRPLESGGARIEVTDEDGTQWELDVAKDGSYEVVASWNAAGDLADVPVPEYVEDLLTRLE
jgi:hypothetical protein